jgi:hypothetical protein
VAAYLMIGKTNRFILLVSHKLPGWLQLSPGCCASKSLLRVPALCHFPQAQIDYSNPHSFAQGLRGKLLQKY